MSVLEVKECTIKVLRPVHIGCGETYEPFSFTMDINSGKILIFDMNELFRAMDQKLREEFSSICREGTVNSLLKMYKFLRRLRERKDIVDKEGVVSRRIAAANGLIRHYEEVLSSSRGNQGWGYSRHGGGPSRSDYRVVTEFTISRTAFNALGGEFPVIPGSSIKGAIRTAVLNMWRHNAQGGRYRDNENRKLESDILKGKFHSDPFSLVKVSDFHPVGVPEMKVVYGVNVKKSSGRRGRGPYQILEAILKGEFRGTISIMRPENKREVRQPLSFEAIEKALRAFYGRELKREEQEFKSSGININGVSLNGLPIRIGRHSGAECVTIEGFRRIKIMGTHNRWLDHTTTIWVASEDRRRPIGAAPFGWCEFHM